MTRSTPSRSPKQPPPTRTRASRASSAFGNQNQMRVAYIVISALVVCSMLAVALATIDFTGLWDDGEDDVVVDPNADLIADQQTVVAGNPDDVDQVLLLANLLANTGRMSEAMDWYERALDLAPEDNSIRLDFARSLQTNAMPTDAEAQFLQVLQQDADSISGHYYLAELYMDWKPQRREEARTHYERVIQINPQSFLAEEARLELELMDRSSPVASPGMTTPVDRP